MIAVGAGGAAAGHLLAAATGRPLLQVELADLADTIKNHADKLIALIGLAEHLAGIDDWPGMFAPRLGVLTARDISALVCLVYRTLTADAVSHAKNFLILHPSDGEAPQADAVEFAEFGPLRTSALRTLRVRSHGNECSINLPNAVICGRSDHLGTPLPLTIGERRAPSCLRGDGCYHHNLSSEQRFSAADIDAQIVFAQSCGAIALGNNQMTHEVGVGIGFLSGSSVAVFGALGKHLMQPGSRHEFEIALAKGMPLGDVLEAVNSLAHSTGSDLSRFGLLGDPALTFAVPPSGSEKVRSGPASGDVSWFADPMVERIAFLRSTVIPRLSRLRWLGLPVDDAMLSPLHKQVDTVFAEWAAGRSGQAIEELVDQVGAMQADLMDGLIRNVHSSWWSYIQEQLAAFRQISSQPRTCPACQRDRAVLLRFQHRVETELILSTMQCRRCYDVWWSTGDGPDVAVTRQLEDYSRRGSVASISRDLVNPAAEELVGAIGFAPVAGSFQGMLGFWSAQRRVEPMSREQVEWTVDVSSSELILKDYEATVLTLFNGVYSATQLQLCLLGEP
ncbi:hypothetical protein ACW9HJ_26915 [Nocardia gipuzkoensis]